MTIRKKFTDQVDDTTNTNDVTKISVNNVKNIDEKVKMKNGLLKQEINELRAKLDDLGIENEVVKTKNESLKKFIHCLEEKLESEYKSSKKVKEGLHESKIDDDKILENVNNKKNKKIKHLNT